MHCLNRSSVKSESGAAMAEAALLLPVVFMVLFGIVQYGLLLSAHIVLRNASAVAARVRVLENGTDANAQDAARAALVPPLSAASLPNSNISVTAATINGGTGRTVSLFYDYPLMFSYIVPGSSLGKLRIRASTTMK